MAKATNKKKTIDKQKKIMYNSNDFDCSGNMRREGKQKWQRSE